MTLTRDGRSIDIPELRRRHPIQDVVAASGVELRATGRGWMGCCPFHDDTTASLSVAGVPDKFHCFGCGATGDVIDYVARLHGVGFRDAVTLLDRSTPFRMPLSSPPHAPGLRHSAGSYVEVAAERALEVNTLAWQWFTRPVGHEYSLSYLRHRRRIDLRRAELETGMVLVGHTGHGWTNLADHLRGHGVTDDELIALDLAQPSRRGTLIDTLRDRLVVPVSDTHGRITGFVGRDTSGHPKAPKYRNPTHTAVFDKGTCLYRPARTTVRDATVVVVEGPLDALAITAAAAAGGLTEQLVACSTLGTTVTPSQARQVLGISTEPPVIALDGDPAGEDGTLRWIDAICRNTDRLALVAHLPEGLDPAEWLARHGRAGLAALDPAQRHTSINDEALHVAYPRLPGRELATLACRGPHPARTAIDHVLRLDPDLSVHGRGQLVGSVVAEMTRQGWNPNDVFSRALAHALTRPPPDRRRQWRPEVPTLAPRTPDLP